MRPPSLPSIAGVAAAALVAVSAVARADAGDDDAEARVDVLARELAALRGVELREPIDRQIVPQADLCRRLLARLEPRAAPGAFALPSGGAGGELGLAAAWRGYYDAAERRIYLSDRARLRGEALARDVARAVQDRHVDRRAFLRAAASADERAARLGLVEGAAAALVVERAMVRSGGGILWGDASLERLVQSFGAGAQAAERRLAGLSASVRERALFPYRDGLAFVARIRRHHPWSRVDEVYERPPLSTAHILHPERYERYERPYRIERGGVGLEGMYRRVDDDVLGELGLRTWLIERGVPRGRAARAADGWGGDRFAVYAPPRLLAGVWPELAVSVSAWRTELDAVEFTEAAARALAELSGGAAPARDGRRVLYRSDAGPVFWLERRGPVVVVAVGALAGLEDATGEAVWTQWRVEGEPAGELSPGGR
jgi:hypothetical protein